MKPVSETETESWTETETANETETENPKHVASCKWTDNNNNNWELSDMR